MVPGRPRSTVTLTSDLNPAREGRTIALTASVEPPAASGNVDFYELGHLIASVPIVSGVATLQRLLTTTGSRTFMAIYAGDASLGPSSAFIVEQVSPRNVTAVTLVSSQNPALVSRTITLTATLQPAIAGASVDLYDSNTRIATLTPAGAAATLQYVLPQTPGTLQLRAAYAGDTANAPSSATVNEQVDVRFPTGFSVSSGANPSPTRNVSLTAWVTPATLSGAVTFSDIDGVLATVPLVNGKATLAYHSPSFRARTITASFPGDSEYAAVEEDYEQLFNGIYSTTTLTSNIGSPAVGQPFTLTASIWPTAATGAVSFAHSGNALGTVSLVNGTASLVWQCPIASSEVFTASYSGDTLYTESTGQLPVEVRGLLTTTDLASSGSASIEGSLVKLTATVVPPLDSGTVTIDVDGVAFATAPITAGVATILTSTLPAGNHRLVAEYSGGPVYRSSRSAELSYRVTPVQGPYLRVLAPNNGETWTVGAPAEIRWDASSRNVAPRVSLFVSRTLSPPIWESIAENVPNTGSYTWMVTGPGTMSGPNSAPSALVAVMDYSGHAGSDASDLPFFLIEQPTATIVTRLDAEATDLGVRVTWALSDPALFASIELQRAPNEVGPWTHVAAEVRDEAGLQVADDATVVGGQTYWYRLLATGVSGARQVFGPLTVTASGPRAFALGAAWPNPSHGRVALPFAVARPARVELDLIDLMGREVTVLAAGDYPAGRYELDWDARTPQTRVAPGVYFVQYRTPGKTFVRRVAIVP